MASNDSLLSSNFSDEPEVKVISLHNNRLEAKVTNYGATLTSLKFEDNEMVIGFDRLIDYQEQSDSYFGSTVGRVGNRQTDTMTIEDRYNAVYVMLLIIGVGTVLPFNMLINAGEYFVNAKLNSNSTSPVLVNMRDSFMSYLGMASTLPNVILQAINLFYNTGGGNIRRRICYSIVIELVLFTAIIMLTTYTIQPELFFVLIITLATLVNSAGGIYQNSGFGLSANLPMSYTNAVICGSNIGGVFASFANVIAIYTSGGTRFSPITFFVIAQGFLVIAFFTCIQVYRNKFFFSFQLLSGDDSSEKQVQINKRNDLAHYRLVLSEIWPECLNVFLTFFISATLFPAVQGAVKPLDNWLPSLYFAPLFTFANFNLFATIGNAVTFWEQFPRIPKNKVVYFTMVRFMFVPFFLYFCNYQPMAGRSTSTLFANDVVFIIGGSILGFSSGYLSSICMMYAPKSVGNPENAELAAMMAGFALIFGVFSGLSISYVMPFLV